MSATGESGVADRVLIDTDVLVDHLRGVREIVFRPGLHYSLITRCELFAGPALHEGAVRNLLDGMSGIGISPEVAELAGRIRRETSIATPDALIAATALRHDLGLVSRNRRHFERVANLRLDSP